MVGRSVELTVQKDAPTLGDRALVVEGLSVIDAKDQIVVDNVSFDVRAGEIVAIAGVQGNGQTELTEALVGLEHRVQGSVLLGGEQLVGASVRRILDEGVGFVPEDRQEHGLVGKMTIAENLVLDRTNGPPFVRAGSLRLGYISEFAEQKFKEFDVRGPGIEAPVGTLSGGNQQKVVLARELSRELSLLVAAQPTRGVDVGSIEFIHKRIVETRDAGIPVIVVSTELDEVTALADRIIVMYRGRIIGIVPGNTPRGVLGLMMAGEVPTEAPTDDRGVAA
jgi:simple sugar transport system ATP-binding protein